MKEVGLKKIILGIILLTLIGGSLFMLLNTEKVFKGAPEIRLNNSQGKVIQSHHFQGKFKLVHFWASWCPPCVEELPELISLSKKLKEQPIQFILISTDTEWSEALKLARDGEGLNNVSILLDPSSKTAESFGTYQLPETYLLDGTGGVRMKWVGTQKWNSPEAVQGLKGWMSQP